MTAGQWVLVWILAMWLWGTILMGYDKWAAKRRPQGRIRERTLWIVAALGGAGAMTAAMVGFHHKTRHNQFKFGLPCLVIAHIALILFLHGRGIV